MVYNPIISVLISRGIFFEHIILSICLWDISNETSCCVNEHCPHKFVKKIARQEHYASFSVVINRTIPKLIKHLPQDRCFFVAQIQSKNTPRLKQRTIKRYFNVADNSEILLRNKCSFLRFYPFIQLEGYENMKANDQNAFIRMPKSLIYGDKYRFLSVHAKLQYTDSNK